MSDPNERVNIVRPDAPRPTDPPGNPVSKLPLFPARIVKTRDPVTREVRSEVLPAAPLAPTDPTPPDMSPEMAMLERIYRAINVMNSPVCAADIEAFYTFCGEVSRLRGRDPPRSDRTRDRLAADAELLNLLVECPKEILIGDPPKTLRQCRETFRAARLAGERP